MVDRDFAAAFVMGTTMAFSIACVHYGAKVLIVPALLCATFVSLSILGGDKQ